MKFDPQAAEDEAASIVQKVLIGSVLIYLCKTSPWPASKRGWTLSVLFQRITLMYDDE